MAKNDLFGNLNLTKDDTTKLLTFNLDREITSEAAVSESFYRDGAGIISIPYDFSTLSTDELQLIQNYRELASTSEVDEALQEIRNEVFVFDVPDKKAFDINFNNKTKLSSSIQKKIQEEFDYLYDLIDFDSKGTQWFDDWYVDSRLFLHKIIDNNVPRKGIKKVVVVDPLKIRKVRIVPEPRPDGTFDISRVRDVYIYRAWDHRTHPLQQVVQFQHGTQVQGIQIHPDAIAYINSGLFDRNLGRYVGYLKKAIIPYNNLKMMEEAMIIFRVVRAPQRRAIYIDVSGLQKNRAEEYIKNMMAKFQTKMTYDTKTGSLADRRNIVSMMEDYWLPRRDGGKGTEISTLEGQSSQDTLDEVEYLRDKLWRSLNVPRGRLTQETSTFDFGRGTQIQRDEYRFTKFLSLLRSRFLVFMEDLLRTQLVLKKIIRTDEWGAIKAEFKWTFAEDNNFVELKETEALNNRLGVLQTIDPFVGKYFSLQTVKKVVLRQNDQEIEAEKQQIQKEKDAGEILSPDGEGGPDGPTTQQPDQPPQPQLPAADGDPTKVGEGQDGYIEQN